MSRQEDLASVLHTCLSDIMQGFLKILLINFGTYIHTLYCTIVHHMYTSAHYNKERMVSFSLIASIFLLSIQAFIAQAQNSNDISDVTDLSPYVHVWEQHMHT